MFGGRIKGFVTLGVVGLIVLGLGFGETFCVGLPFRLLNRMAQKAYTGLTAL